MNGCFPARRRWNAALLLAVLGCFLSPAQAGLMSREYVNCPLDGHGFAVWLTSSGTSLGATADLEPRVVGASPLDTSVITCPRCCYSAPAYEFEVPLRNAAWVRAALEPIARRYGLAGHVPPHERYRYALVCARAEGKPPLVLAELLLESSWLLRQRALPAAQFAKLRREARDHFVLALAAGIPPDEDGNEDHETRLRALYLTAVLAAELGDLPAADRAFEQLEAQRSALGRLEGFHASQYLRHRIRTGRLRVPEDYETLPAGDKAAALGWLAEQGLLGRHEPLVRAALGSGDETLSRAALQAILDEPDPSFVDVYVEALSSSRFWDAHAGVQALVELEATEAVPALIAALGGPARLDSNLVRALNQLGTPEALEAAIGHVAERLDVRSFPPPRDQDRRFTASDLALILYDRPRPQWLPLWLEAFRNELDLFWASRQLQAVARHLRGWPDALPALLESHARAEDHRAKLALAMARAYVGDQSAAPELLAEIHSRTDGGRSWNASDPEALSALVHALGSLEKPEHGQLLLAASRGRNEWLRTAALDALARLERLPDRPVFRKALRHRSSLVRFSAVRGMARMEDAEKALARMAADRDPEVAGEAMQALAERGCPRCVEALRRALRHPEAEHRAKAASRVARSALPERAALLGPLLTDGDEHVQSVLARTLAAREAPADLGLLERLATSDFRDVRRVARQALRRLRAGS
jgi:HEAT repeat protein